MEKMTQQSIKSADLLGEQNQQHNIWVAMGDTHTEQEERVPSGGIVPRRSVRLGIRTYVGASATATDAIATAASTNY